MLLAAADARRSDIWKMLRLAPARFTTRTALHGRSRPRRPHVSHRSAIYAAGAVVILAAFILRLAQWLYGAGLMSLAGIEAAVRVSQRLRRFGGRLLHR